MAVQPHAREGGAMTRKGAMQLLAATAVLCGAGAAGARGSQGPSEGTTRTRHSVVFDAKERKFKHCDGDAACQEDPARDYNARDVFTLAIDHARCDSSFQ